MYYEDLLGIATAHSPIPIQKKYKKYKIVKNFGITMPPFYHEERHIKVYFLINDVMNLFQ